MKNISKPEEVDWHLVGDFNLMRCPANRNKPGGDITQMVMFNEAISALGLVELPLLGRQCTWSNKQFELLLVCLDWFFTSNSWTLSYPHTSVWKAILTMSSLFFGYFICWKCTDTSQSLNRISNMFCKTNYSVISGNKGFIGSKEEPSNGLNLLMKALKFFMPVQQCEVEKTLKKGRTQCRRLPHCTRSGGGY